MSDYETICNVEDIAVGECKMFVLEDTPIGVFRLEDGFFALDDRCPHAGASLTRGVLDDDIVRCRIHHWGFCVRDGNYVDQDNPRFDARTFEVRVKGNQVEIRRQQ